MSAKLAHDGRRLRPNLVVGGVKGPAERTWPRACLRIQEVLIGVRDLRSRCVMTTYDPDTLEQDRRVLKGNCAQNFGRSRLRQSPNTYKNKFSFRSA